MKERLKQLGSLLRAYPAAICFLVFITGFMVLDMCWPTREFSELENTMLDQKPAFSFQALFSNEWTADYGEYVKDQIALRDSWIDLQSRSESLLLQKAEIGGILIGKDRQLFTEMFTLTRTEQRTLPNNIKAVEQFAQRHGDKVTVLIAPSASAIYPEKLPFAAPMLDEDSWLDQTFAAVEAAGGNVLDLRSTFTEHKDEYIYYRTDHHWTTYGAQLAYEEFCAQQGLTPFDTESHTRVDVPEFLGTSYSKSRYWHAKADVLTYYPLDNEMTIFDVTVPGQRTPKSTSGLYDTAKLEVVDKYATFLYGNNGYSEIQGDGEGSILLVKDSYGNCFAPFLTANYSKIGVVDLRNYPYGIDELIENEGYEHVLILYNFQSFKSDSYLYNINRDPIE
ncbi:hypothetical protein H6B33_03345 [Gemmiger formicilis]|uniref:DHHW family protein n=1 Tax=Gemmiger formicilis TaxID=745368 RepID=UPI00195B36FB|nr:DHHW family protein [Gemmiger formicilis]MBM6914438.1 hypothetical protein [Gemmiger formicilis]